MTAIIQSVGAFNYENRFSFYLPMRNKYGDLRSRGWVLTVTGEPHYTTHKWFESLKAAKYEAYTLRLEV